MRRMRFFSAILGILFLLSSFSSCKGLFRQRFQKHSFSYFDTVTTVIGYELNERIFEEKAQMILQKLGEYHSLFDIYHSYEGINNLHMVNEVANGEHREVAVDERIIDLLLYSKEIYEKTNGTVNVAMGSVLDLWHTQRKIAQEDASLAALPPMDALQAAAMHTNVNDVVIDIERSTVFLSDPQMRLDVGAIAKGYAVERVAQWMEEQGIQGYSLNVGGNVRTVGKRGDGKSWSVGIENPNATEEHPYLRVLRLDSAALVTSGSYQRFYTVNGNNYHHIIDPKTLMPSKYFASVSIVCRDSALADALSTAVFCMPYDEGLAFVNTLEQVEALWCFSDGTVKTTDGFQNYLAE